MKSIGHTLRIHGRTPFTLVVLHGGPGASGELAPVARQLSRTYGTLEPIETASSIEAQLEELHQVVSGHAELPATIIGHSWGAWLGYLLAARFPTVVRKLILIGTPPFEENDAALVMETRLSRLTVKQRKHVYRLIETLARADGADRNRAFDEFGKFLTMVDSFDPLPEATEEAPLEFQAGIFQRVWSEAKELRKSGDLLACGNRIQCPVIAIHGDYDPHPSEGVERPLKQVLKQFQFISLKNCGHTPWNERQARDNFFRVLSQSIGSI